MFAALCLVLGSLWLMPQVDTSPAAQMEVLAVAATIPALAAGGWLLRLGCWGLPGREVWPLAAAGIGILGAPTLLFAEAQLRFNAVMGTATLAAVPVIAAVTVGLLDEGGEGFERRLIPALAAFGGALLVLPMSLPGSDRGWSGFGLYLLSAALLGGVGVVCWKRLRSAPRLEGFFVIAAANAVFAWLAWLWTAWASARAPQAPLWAFPWTALSLIVIAAFGAAALIVLSAAIEPVALATRFLWIPWIAAAEAFLLLRPSLSGRTAAGALLMLLGGGALLRRGPAAGSDGRMSLR